MGFLYGISEAHKQQRDDCLPFHSNLSVLQTHTFSFPILNSSTISEYAVKNFFQFAEMICEKDATFFLRSLDVYSLLTNILLNGTADNCVNQLFENTNTVESFTNSKFKQLCLAIKETFFMLNY